MKKIFFKPLKTVFVILILGGIGFFSNIATLTNFNIVKWYKEKYPQSLIYLIFLILVIYLILVVYGFLKNQIQNQNNTSGKQTSSLASSKNGVTQTINSQKIEGSTIKMVGGDLNEHNKEN